MNKVLANIGYLLLVLALLMTGLGGFLDFQSRGYRLSKEHLWNDGTFLAVIGVGLLVLAGVRFA